jgi:hypothetical protein
VIARNIVVALDVALDPSVVASLSVVACLTFDWAS